MGNTATTSTLGAAVCHCKRHRGSVYKKSGVTWLEVAGVVFGLQLFSLNQSINQSTNWGWGSSGCSLLGMSSVALLTTRVLAVVLLLFLLPLLLLLVEATTVTWWSHCACGGRVATLSRLGPLGMTSHPMVLSCFL